MWRCRSPPRTICSCTVPHERLLDLRILRHYLLSCLGGSGHGALMPSAQFLDNASLVPLLLSSSTSPTPSPHCYYPRSLPRVCCTLLLLSVPPSPTMPRTVVLSRPAHTCSLARPDGWGAKGGEPDGERGESRVISIQRPLYSGAALRSNAIKGLCIITSVRGSYVTTPGLRTAGAGLVCQKLN